MGSLLQRVQLELEAKLQGGDDDADAYADADDDDNDGGDDYGIFEVYKNKNHNQYIKPQTSGHKQNPKPVYTTHKTCKHEACDRGGSLIH